MLGILKRLGLVIFLGICITEIPYWFSMLVLSKFLDYSSLNNAPVAMHYLLVWFLGFGTLFILGAICSGIWFLIKFIIFGEE
jgi:hypothetical protein